MSTGLIRTVLAASTAYIALSANVGVAHAQAAPATDPQSTPAETVDPAAEEPAPPPAPAAGTASGQLEEIVVTARKREERLQDLGASATALSPAELERRPDIDLSSFANAAPNVIIDDMQEGPGSPASMTIRGIGTSDHERSIDPTIGVVVDGVFIGTVGGAMVKALDVQRLQILRGPQGTLFGRNSIGGAVLLERRQPEFGGVAGEARVGYGNFNDVLADGYISVPLGDKAAVKIGGAYNRHDGYFRNTTLDRRQGEERSVNFNAAIKVEPVDNVQLYYRYDKDSIDQDAAVIQNVATADQAWCFFYGQCGEDEDTPQGGSRYESVQNDPDFGAYFNSSLHVGSARWDVGNGYALDYLFGHFRTDEDGRWDFDGTPLTLYHTQRPQQYRQTSHEVRLSFDNDGTLSYTAGLYSYRSRYHINNLSFIGFGDLLFGLPFGTVLEVPQDVSQKTKSYAAFFEGDIKVTDALTFTAGGRYTKDKKHQSVIDPLFPNLDDLGGPENPASKSWGQFTPKLGARYRFSPDVMAYGLYSRGFRAGGFSGRPGTYEAVVTPYDPETVDNFELGLKSQWLNDRLRVNVAGYHMRYKDKQEELSVPVDVVGGTGQQTLFVNAATARLQGVELEVAIVPLPGLSINSALGYLDAKYTEFDDPLTGESLTDLKLRRAPKWTFSLSPAYDFEVGGGKASLSATYYHLSSYHQTFWNTDVAKVDNSKILDAQASWRFNNTTFAIYGRNLLKDDSYTIGLDVGRSATFPGLWTFVATRPPRTYGFNITQRF